VFRSIGVLLVVAAGTVLPAAATAAPPASNLFTITSRAATLAPNGDAYRLTLTAPKGSFLRFSDRPQRLAGRESMSTFASRWAARGFSDDPPNANVVVDGAGSMVLELSHPHVRGGRISFHARRVGGDRHLPRRLGMTHLFIDDASTQSAYNATLTVQGAGTVTLTFDAGTTAFVGGGGDEVQWVMGGAGGGYVLPSGVRYQTNAGPDGGSGGLLGFGVLTSGPITGTAVVPAGATVTLQAGDSAPVPISNGAFSVPVS
jgi:hypothetical protein